MKVLLAGATGVVGRYAVNRLVADGYTVVPLVRRPDSATTLARLGAFPVVADLLAWSSLNGIVPQVDVVVHLATAIPADPSVPGAWLANDRVRVAGTMNLIRLARQCGARRYVQQSITRLYASNGASWIDEGSPLAEVQPAHLDSAVHMEQIVQALDELEWVILRGGYLYGAGTGTTERLVKQAVEGGMLLEGDGTQYISPLHPSDMAQAVSLALDVLPPRSLFNVVDDEPVPQLDFFARIRDLVNPAARLFRATGQSPVPSRRCTNGWLRAFGFTPTYPNCAKGLADALFDI